MSNRCKMNHRWEHAVHDRIWEKTKQRWRYNATELGNSPAQDATGNTGTEKKYFTPQDVCFAGYANERPQHVSLCTTNILEQYQNHNQDPNTQSYVDWKVWYQRWKESRVFGNHKTEEVIVAETTKRQNPCRFANGKSYHEMNQWVGPARVLVEILIRMIACLEWCVWQGIVMIKLRIACVELHERCWNRVIRLMGYSNQRCVLTRRNWIYLYKKIQI